MSRNSPVGYIIPDDGDGRPVRLPDHVLNDEAITWPMTMPEKDPGKPVVILTPSDFYNRHELIDGKVFVYLRDHRLVNGQVPADIVQAVRSQGPT